MVIVSGHLLVDPDGRDAYLDTCRSVVEAARSADGCLDFALSADVVEPGRINILERWATQGDVDRFRGAGTPDEQAGAIRSAEVHEFDVSAERRLA